MTVKASALTRLAVQIMGRRAVRSGPSSLAASDVHLDAGLHDQPVGTP